MAWKGRLKWGERRMAWLMKLSGTSGTKNWGSITLDAGSNRDPSRVGRRARLAATSASLPLSSYHELPEAPSTATAPGFSLTHNLFDMGVMTILNHYLPSRTSWKVDLLVDFVEPEPLLFFLLAGQSILHFRCWACQNNYNVSLDAREKVDRSTVINKNTFTVTLEEFWWWHNWQWRTRKVDLQTVQPLVLRSVEKERAATGVGECNDLLDPS